MADIHHFIRVARTLEWPWRGQNAAVVAAFLHDAIEDDLLTEVEVEELLPPSEAEAVKIVTRRDGETYANYIARVRDSGNLLAIAIKIADLKDNLARSEQSTQWADLAKRYRKALAVLLDSQE